jgi:D-3-phosphoglycerate dehydrogenase
MRRVLITDDCHALLINGLEEMGWMVDFEPNISPDETKDRITAYEGLVINSKILVNREFLDKAVQLQFVARLGSGMEIVDREYAAEKGVKVWSSPEGNRNAVAEQALGMLLGLANHLPRADREVRQNIWKREANRGWELKGKTLGIIGFGHTGSQFARKLAGMEMRVLAYDKYKPEGFAAEMSWVSESNLAQIQADADVISLHLPLTSETRHFVDQSFLQRCKRGFVLINTARGKNVHTEDLVLSLESGQTGGACLDVFENEKPETFTEKEREWYKRLHQMENVVLSPHVAGWTHESKKLLAEILLQKIIKGE